MQQLRKNTEWFIKITFINTAHADFRPGITNVKKYVISSTVKSQIGKT
jgi:hypothetical protein